MNDNDRTLVILAAVAFLLVGAITSCVSRAGGVEISPNFLGPADAGPVACAAPDVVTGASPVTTSGP